VGWPAEAPPRWRSPAQLMSAQPRRRRLQRPDLRLIERQTGPDWVLDTIYLLQPVSRRGKAWLEANADGRQWIGSALLVDYGGGSMAAAALEAGLAVTGCGPVYGAMLWTVREHCAPDLTIAQLAARLGFTVQEWRLMENDDRLVPDPDDFWDRAMDLVGGLDAERERRADMAGFN
jgi:hypothetical protein